MTGVLSIRLLTVVRLPHALGNLHVGEDGGERRLLGGARIDAEADLLGCCRHVADAHLTEVHAIGGALDAVVVLAAGETVPHGLHIGGDGRRRPVGIAVVGDDAAQVLELVVLIFDGPLQPVLAVEVHHDTALVEAVVALREIGLHHEAEELLARLHLKHGRIVVLEVIVRALPQVGVRGGGDEEGVASRLKPSRLSRPLEAALIDGAAVGECFFYIVLKLHDVLFFVLVSASNKHQTDA